MHDGGQRACTTLIMIRHGETEWNRQRRMQGQADSPLSATGRAQARALAEKIAGTEFAALYASDLGRAYETARVIAQRTGSTLIADPRLRERSFGIFEGLTHEEMMRDFPHEHRLFRGIDPDYAVPGGESARQCAVRAVGFLDEIIRRHADETVVAVTHGMVLASVYRHVTGQPLTAPRNFQLFNAGLNVLRCDGGCWAVETWGDVDHLGADAVTPM